VKEQRRCRSRQQEWMLAFDEGRVPLLDALTHLERCPDCRDFAATAVRVRHELSRRPVPEAQPAADMDLLARLRQESARPLSRLGSHLFHGVGSTSHRPLAIRRLTAAGAVALLLLSLHLALRRGAPSRGPRQPSTVLVRQPSPPSPLPAPPRQPVVAAGQKERSERHTRESPSSAMLQQTHGGDIDGVRTSVRHVGAEAPFHDASDDLQALNGNPLREARQWAPLHRDEWERIEAQVRRRVRVRDDFVTIPFPRVAAASDRQLVAATEAYKREAVIVDARLAREVTCAFKATALSDLCDRLRGDTGIQLVAGNSVADEKVTLFCEKLPLREVMRQLSRPFGYTWLRSGKPGEYHYELVQDLKSQLLEEELRNRDRNAALLALEQEMSRYRRFLELSPDEALARARSAAPEEKKLLENLSSWGWGPIHMYFRLSPRDLATLRSGQKLTFGIEGQIAEKLPGLVGGAGEQPLPSELRRGVLQSLRDRHVVMRDGRYWNAPADDPGGVPLTTVPEARPIVTLDLHQSELGQFTLDGHSGFAIVNTNAVGKVTMGLAGQGPYASGWSPVVLQPDNREANAKLAGDPTLHARISIALDARRQAPGASEAEPAGAPAGTRAWRLASSASRVTTADVLEAIHQATGRPVVGDFYTRLYKPETASVRNQPLFDALNQIADAMHLRWSKDGTWLQFRSSGYYNDRLKEVPNRFLARWAAARRQRGVLTLDELLEIAQLSDAQLDATEMAEGARDCWGLAEWNLPRGGFQRPHLRYLAQLISAQRQEAMGPAGLPFMRMSLMQQQQFIAMISSMSMGPPPLQSLDEVAGASLRVAYTRPGEFQVQVPAAPGGREREPVELALVREPTRVAALQAAHRFNPDVEPGEIVPTELAVTILYTLGSPRTKRTSIAVRATPGSSMGW
jgi:hypothetical protein